MIEIFSGGRRGEWLSRGERKRSRPDRLFWPNPKMDDSTITPSPRSREPFALDESGCFAIFSDATASLIAAP
jgi:hypothetical protein